MMSCNLPHHLPAITISSASMPATNGFHISSLESYLQTVGNVNQSSFPDDGERSKALLAAYALVSRLESPWETVCRVAMTQVII